jgi:hypothetical protein
MEAWYIGFVINLCGSSIPRFLFFKQQCCDDHEVICKHGSSHEQFESLASLGEATLHAAAAEENRDASFDAGTETLTILEGRVLFIGGLARRLFSAALRNAHQFDAGVFAIVDILLAEESPIGTVELRYLSEGFLVTLHRVFNVNIICGISVEHPILRDQPVGTLRDVDFMPELYRFQDLAPFDQVGVSFENRKYLFFVRNLLFVKHASTRLINDAIPKFAVIVNLLSNCLNCYFSHQINAADAFSLFEHLACVSYHLFGGVDERAIFRNQPIMPLFRCHPLDFLVPASGTASAVNELRYALRKQVTEISNQTTNDAYGIPQQGAIRWVVNVRFDDGCMDAQFLAVFQPELSSVPDDQIVDHLECRRRESVKRSVESIMFGNRLAIEASEFPESIAITDTLPQFAVMPVFYSLKHKRTQHLLGGEAAASGLRILEPTIQVLAHLIYQVSVFVNEIRNGLKHWLQAYALIEKFQIGKADLGARGSCHLLAF